MQDTNVLDTWTDLLKARAEPKILPFLSGFFFLFSSLGGGLWTAAAGEVAGGGPDAAGGAGSGLHSTLASPDVMVTQTKRGKQKHDFQDEQD